MTTPTTNLLEWIDERIKEISLSDPMPCFPVTRIEELNRIKTRILQEVENEKAVIVNDVIVSKFNFIGTTVEKYYNPTFNPNNDESNS
jgi:hypothetical protein